MPAVDLAERVVDGGLEALATFRLTRMATTDKVGEPLRKFIVDTAGALARDPVSGNPERVEAARKTAREFAECWWCTSVWIAGGQLVVRRVFPRTWRKLRAILALSAIAGVAGERA